MEGSNILVPEKAFFIFSDNPKNHYFPKPGEGLGLLVPGSGGPVNGMIYTVSTISSDEALKDNIRITYYKEGCTLMLQYPA